MMSDQSHVTSSIVQVSTQQQQHSNRHIDLVEVSEVSSLLPSSNIAFKNERRASTFDLKRASVPTRKYLPVATLSVILTTIVLLYYDKLPHRHQQQLLEQQHENVIERTNTSTSSSTKYRIFSRTFVWGVATSSYQIEGAVYDDQRGLSIWDVFVQQPNAIMDHSTGNVADDYYHLYPNDIALMKSLHIQAYRFSIAWSRIIPNAGMANATINYKGIEYYNNVIDTLLHHNILPWITLFHWDLPQTIQEQYNAGWYDERTVDAFVEYANIIFQHFHHKVKHFITINEPWTYSVVGHGMGIHAPGRKDLPSTEPYIVAHHMLLAHAKVSKLYKTKYGGNDGIIGISNCGDYRYPKNSLNQNDQDAAERAMLFQWGWFVDPIVFGDYPNVMRERLGNRLPSFTMEEQYELMHYTDFLGLNYYSSLLASTPEVEATYEGYWADIHVNFTDDSNWEKNAMGWNIVPDGLREMLLWISTRYNNPLLYITENGSAEEEAEKMESIVHDEKRRMFFEQHINACADAIDKHEVNLGGYFAWSFLDNFEWQFGYQRRFGLCHVNYTNQQRTPRDSAYWYREHITYNEMQDTNNDENLYQDRLNCNRLLRTVHIRTRPTHLPEKVLIGYGSSCDKVRQAVYDGVNIVIWSFIDIVKVSTMDEIQTMNQRDLFRINQNLQDIYTISTNLNLTEIHDLINELYNTGYEHVLHFVSFGGWNGAHIDTSLSEYEWYETFHSLVGDIFDGIDWDLEGNDSLDSPYNYFTIECLDHMGRISQLAKNDGKFVSIAPPQSYMNINSVHFSRYVNLTNKERTTPPPYSTFSYYGSNVYSYLLQQYGSSIDLISIQFYESYSEATYAIYHDGMTASDYLLQYIHRLVESNESFYVNFTEDSDIVTKDLPLHNVSFPLQKLVFGFGNGWIGTDNNKTVYISAIDINRTWCQLNTLSTKQLPKGFMFWSINNEGENDVYFAKELSNILLNTT